MSSQNLAELVRNATPGSADGFEPIPVGTYRAAVSGAEWTVAKTGTIGFKAELTVQDGEYSGRKIWERVYITDKSIPVALGKLIALGTTQAAVADAIAADNGESPAVATVCRDLIDSVVDVTIKHEEYQGKTQMRVTKLAPVSGTGADPLASVQGVAAAPAAARPTSPF
jgi:hypothetical protein